MIHHLQLHLLCLWSGSIAGNPFTHNTRYDVLCVNYPLQTVPRIIRVQDVFSLIASILVYSLCFFHVCVYHGLGWAGAPSCSAPLRAPSRSSWTGPGRPGRSGRAPGRRSAAPRRSRLWSDGSSVAAGCRSSYGGLLKSLTSWCCHHDKSSYLIIIAKCLFLYIFK